MNIVSRAGWGARAPTCSTPLTSGLRGLAVHYSAANSDETLNHQNCAAKVKGIQNYHMDSHGWCDIAYNHLLCRHGVVFAGRGFGKRSAANGTNPGNSEYFAACFLGDDTIGRRDFTPEAQNALVMLRREYLRRYPSARETVGHRDITSTACPGDEIEAFIRSASYRAAVAQQGRLPGPSPKPAWFWTAADLWLSGVHSGLPGPSPKPAWFWLAVEQWVEQH